MMYDIHTALEYGILLRKKTLPGADFLLSNLVYVDNIPMSLRMAADYLFNFSL
jgi:hypothetical protein